MRNGTVLDPKADFNDGLEQHLVTPLPRALSEEWDTGPGDSASFPTPWMSADGGTLDLVFSGNDAFSVRRAAILVRDADASR